MVRILVCAEAHPGISKATSKTVAKAAEQNRRRELEEGFNNIEDVRQERVRTIREIAGNTSTAYKLRHPRSATFAEYAIGHVKRLVGDKMLVDMNEASVKVPEADSARDRTEVNQ